MPEQPNILFIMADDHASKAISCYGAGINQTPNLDRIAEEGMRLNHCYVTNSICTPSRASILCGTYNHVNGVLTLETPINNRLPNVAKHLRTGGYQTAIIGKWHLGEGKDHEPTGFDFWSVLPGQGEYFDPYMIEMGTEIEVPGYATDIITDKSLGWLDSRDPSKPFFLMCHHKAPHREWEPHPKNRELYQDDIEIPETFDDDYKNRAKAASEAKMRIRDDMNYFDLGLVQPEGGAEIGERIMPNNIQRKVPNPDDVSGLRLIDKDTGEVFTFKDKDELGRFKYQRYLKRWYLDSRDPSKPFFLMCHHKAPHREWEPHPKNRELYQDDIEIPETFDDDYKNRAKAASEAKMRIRDDMNYFDLGLVQPEGGAEIGERIMPNNIQRKVPNPDDVSGLRLIDKDTGEVFTFKDKDELGRFKYQRYLKRYLRTIASVDESVGRVLDYLDANGLAAKTTSRLALTFGRCCQARVSISIPI